MTDRSHHIDFDGLMNLMAVTGFIALTAWVLASSIGVISGYVSVSPQATLRFLLAVLILVFARRTYWEVREWRWGKLPPDERFGFSNPLEPHGQVDGAGFERRHRPGGGPATTDQAATGSSHPRA
ncbi:MAG: hypothetical protein OEV60_11245 [Actinomycetota bacterium]|nr:hypothetical protein [Actinomycetota bacterium]